MSSKCGSFTHVLATLLLMLLVFERRHKVCFSTGTEEKYPLFHIAAYGHCADTYGYYARDCEDVKDIGFTKSGVYHIVPEGSSRGYDVYCDMDTEEGGWLVCALHCK